MLSLLESVKAILRPGIRLSSSAGRSVLRVGDRLRLKVDHAVWYRPGVQRGFHNDVEMRVFGLQRSGNHAIINWIFLNRPGTVCFLNYIHHDRHFNPFLSFGQSFVKAGEEVVNYQPRLRAKVQMTRRWHRRHPRKDCLIYSYEDRPLETVPDDPLSREHDRCLGTSGEVKNLLILRDPYNTIASRLKLKGHVSPPVVSLWKTYAREFLGETDYLQPGRLTVNYNRWCEEPEYRRSLGDQLGLVDPERGLDLVPDIGGGSSFDSTAFDGQARAMRTSERWREFQGDPRYTRLFDEEIVELAARIFGPMPVAE